MQSHKNIGTALAALALFALPSSAQSTLTKFDLNPAMDGVGSDPEIIPATLAPKGRQMAQLNGEWYFWASTEATGNELFKTNGTAAGTKLVADLTPGPTGSYSGNIFSWGGQLFFTTSSPGEGVELFVTQGTAATTNLLAALYPGPASSMPYGFTATASKLFFTAKTPSGKGSLIVTDGTASGTIVVAGSQSPGVEPLVNNLVPHPTSGGILFTMTDAAHGKELWTSDGTPAGTSLVLDYNPGPSGSYIGSLVALGNRVLFAATNATVGSELCITDGTTAGTTLLMDIEVGALYSSPLLHPDGVLGNQLYFSATEHDVGRELFVTDGTAAGTHLVADNAIGPASSNPVTLGAAGGKMMIQATVGFAVLGAELYSATPSSVALVKDIAPGAEHSYPSEGLVFGGELLFRARGAGGVIQIWKTDGTSAGTITLDAAEPSMSNDAPSLTPISPTQAIYFGTSLAAGTELFATDGTVSGTGLLADINSDLTPQSSWPFGFSSTDGRNLFFSARTSPLSSHLFHQPPSGPLKEIKGALPFSAVWGPIAGDWLGSKEYSTTLAILDAPSTLLFSLESFSATSSTSTSLISSQPSYPTFVMHLGSNSKQIFLHAGDPLHGQELWVSDGTPGGATLLMDINPGPDDGDPMRGTVMDDIFYFPADNGSGGRGLWRSDGTAAGTWHVFDTGGVDYPVPSVSNLTVVGDQMFFTDRDSALDGLLWVTDGTTAGTKLIHDAAYKWGNPLAASVTALTVFQGKLHFLASSYTSVYKRDLWATDGTSAGTQMVASIGDIGEDHIHMVAAGDKLFFSAKKAGLGIEPWAYDGSQAFLIKDIQPGPTGSLLSKFSFPPLFTACGDRVFFAAKELSTGIELYVSDGTAAGTHLVHDIVPGPDSSEPANIAVCNNALYFGATSPEGDYELYEYTQPGAHVVDLGYGFSGARLSATTPTLGSTLTLTLEDAPVGDLGMMLFSDPASANAAFVMPGHASWIDPSTVLFFPATPTQDFGIPLSPVLAGMELNVQAWFLPQASLPATTSNGLRLVFDY